LDLMKPEQLWNPVDPIGQALHLLRMTGSFYCRSELTAPWGLKMPPMKDCLWFHVVTQGSCELVGDGFGPIALSRGDFALVPQGQGHRLRTGARVPTPDVVQLPQQMITERYSLLRHGGGGAPTLLVCGVVQFDHPFARQLIALLPPVIHLGALREELSEWMEGTLKLMATEARQLRTGGETIITRLADILVIQAIRSWIEDAPVGQRGWLAALKDPQIGRALMRIHHDLARDWTVASLASSASMSRSAFAGRFTTLVGDTPMHYLTRARMDAASASLKTGKATLAELASQLGYQSEAAFSRAFKRSVGLAPGTARSHWVREAAATGH
jgi:AraC-like DNA-binding protein